MKPGHWRSFHPNRKTAHTNSRSGDVNTYLTTKRAWESNPATPGYEPGAGRPSLLARYRKRYL